MNHVDTLLIKVASRCNLDCTYCYVYQGQDHTWKLQPKIIHNNTIDSLCLALIAVSKIQEKGFAVVLHGGEPLLIGEDKLLKILSSLRLALPCHYKYPIGIQTNGLLITDKILDICSDYKTSISVSIDGSQNTNDISRLTIKNKSSFAPLIKKIRLLRNHKDSDFLFAGTLSVIQPESDPIETYEFIKGLGSPSIDFILQDGNYSFLPKGKKDFYSTEYGEWLIKLFDYYFYNKNPVKIRFFDDLVRISLGGLAEKEGKGNNNFGIIVIETDGEIRKNDTLRASFEGVDFFENRPNVNNKAAFLDVLKSIEYFKTTTSQELTSNNCLSCNIKNVCGGGMLLSRWSKEKHFDNPSIYCLDHLLYIKHIIKVLGVNF
ncbi:MAG: cyclophane-forming radical SAM/SPASM peptide maturase YhhB [Thiolinea sp.]